MSELDDLLDPGVKETGNSPYSITGDKLPNANATLTLGILSIVGCFLYGLPGLICGIIALALHKKDKQIYLTDKARFENSYKNARGGFVCAIIGTSLSAIYFLFAIALFVFAFSLASSFGRF